MPKTKVVRVIDGDTFQGQRKVFVRLAGVDAPEAGTKGAAAAKQWLDDLISGKTVSYTEEAKSYGRIVGEVKASNKSINREMTRFLKRK